MMMKSYPLYKVSGVEWIGDIPSHWNKKYLRYSFDIQKGKIPKILSEELGENLLPYLSTEVLRTGLFNEYCDKSEGVKVEEGDLLILWDGSKSGEIFQGIDGILSSTMSKMGLNDKKLNKKFSFHLMKYYEKDFRNNTIGMGIPHMDGNHLKSSKIIIPPIEEQTQIVSFLDTKTQKIDELIEKTEQKIELLKEKRTSLINHCVTKGLNPNVEMKDSGVEWIGEIPCHWNTKKVKYTFKIIKNISGELGFDVLSVTQQGIKVKDIVSGKGQISMDYTKYQIVETGDFVMNHMDLLTGYVDISKYRGVTSPDYRHFKLIDNNSISRFFLYLFQMGYKNKIFYKYGQGSSLFGRWRLPSRQFNQFKFPYPSLEEQTQIVEYLDEQTQKIDSTIEKETQRIELLKEYRQSLISEVVTGKVDVRNYNG